MFINPNGSINEFSIRDEKTGVVLYSYAGGSQQDFMNYIMSNDPESTGPGSGAVVGLIIVALVCFILLGDPLCGSRER